MIRYFIFTENTPEVQNCLQTVIQYFTDAAESYSKEKCVRHAQKCIRQARLVALQLHHLSSGSQLLHLTDDQADNVISKHPKFLEVFTFNYKPYLYTLLGVNTKLCKTFLWNNKIKSLSIMQMRCWWFLVLVVIKIDFSSHLQVKPCYKQKQDRNPKSIGIR